MPFIATAIVSILATLATAFGFYNYAPLDVISVNEGTPTFGSTITTIAGSDTLSSSRAVINTNFSNLNTDKIEATQTTLSSLVSIGTITTGVWNGTAIGVAYGGTGTTSPTTYRVLLGNGASGITIASTTGTSGQFLTSNGAGNYPSWTTSAVSQTDDYNFTGSAFRVKNLHASSTAANPITLNTLSYSTPSVRAAS